MQLSVRRSDCARALRENADSCENRIAQLLETPGGVGNGRRSQARLRGGLTIPVDGVGGSWIVTLPSTHFPHVPENEFAMMKLARRVGIAVPDTALIPINEISGLPSGINVVGSNAYAIKRFERAANNTRVHIEDFARVFAVYPERKYDRASDRNIAEVI